jgi:hypothetical protein
VHIFFAGVRSRANWLLKGESCTKFFCSLESKRSRESTIVSITHHLTDQPCATTATRTEAAAVYYERLYTPTAPIDRAAARNIIQHMRPLTDAQRAILNAPITLDELLTAVRHSPRNKTPGSDGLPVELYDTFWTQLGPLLLKVFNHAHESGQMPKSCRSGVLSLLHKKGDRSNLGNYRPLTMLCADYKVISKLLATRLDNVLQQYIHPDQAGFVSGRQITDNLALLTLAQRHYYLNKLKAIGILVDQEKAFDYVEWDYRDMTFDHINVGNDFQRWVNVLHHDASAQVQINGHLSRTLRVRRGTRQGDPLSPGLFVLIEEAFACALRADPLYLGLPLPDERQRSVKLNQLADDKALFASSDSDVQRINHHLLQYELASGAKINHAKSSALLLGAATAADFPSLNVPIIQPGQSVKYLGVLFGPSLKDEAAWQPIVDRFTKVLDSWRHRSLSLAGKVVVIRSLATSVLWYTAAIIPPSKALTDKLQSACTKFLWNGKQSVVNEHIAIAPRSLGGLSMVDISSVCQAFNIKWLKQLSNNQDAAWKSFFLAELAAQPIATKFGLGQRLLLASPTPSHQQLDPFFYRLLSSASSLHLSETPPASYEDVCRQHIFLNSNITDQHGNSLSSVAMKNAASLGVTNLSNYDDIDRNHVPSITANRIKAAIPVSWVAKLATGPASPVVGELFVENIITPPQRVLRVEAINDDTAHLSVRNVNQHGIVQPPTAHSAPITIDLDDFTMHRAHTSETHDDQVIAHGALLATALVPELLRIDQLIDGSIVQRPLSTITVNGSTKALTDYKQQLPNFDTKWAGVLQQQNCKRVTKWIWCRSRNKKCNDFLFKLLHMRLQVGENRHYDVDHNVGCLCGEDLETHLHLLVQCSIVQPYWRWFQRAVHRSLHLHINVNTPSLLFASVPPSRIRMNTKAIWRILEVAHAEALYSIWLQRCNAVFRDEPFTQQSIATLLRQRLRSSFMAAKHLKRIDNFHALSKALISELDAPI